jgi:hypothetical protein
MQEPAARQPHTRLSSVASISCAPPETTASRQKQHSSGSLAVPR